MSFAIFFAHVDDCPRCVRVDLDLCPEGERLRRLASDRLAERVAPIPDERKEPAS